MHDWRQHGYGASFGGGVGQGGHPSREALYVALQRSQQENHRLQEQASRELERLHEENARLRRAALLAAPQAERLRQAEGEASQLRQKLQATEAELEQLHAESARLRAERDAMPAPAPVASGGEDDRLRRLAADLANLRRRQEESVSQARRAARAELVREFVTSVDALEQALHGIVDQESPWYQGIAGVHRQVLAMLRGAGVEPLGSVGEPFSPHLHEAIGSVPAEAGGAVPADHIVSVVQSGYRFIGATGADALIRPARVIVSA